MKVSGLGIINTSDSSYTIATFNLALRYQALDQERFLPLPELTGSHPGGGNRPELLSGLSLNHIAKYGKYSSLSHSIHMC